MEEQAEQHQKWWQKISTPLIIVAITIIVVGVLALVIFGYLLRLAWTGFFNRTLWDWLQLLIVPLVLAIIALVFQLANSRTERQIAQKRYEQDQQIALDKQREDLLQTYLDRISELKTGYGLPHQMPRFTTSPTYAP